jgi:endonuclease YncB( thermonuclease family)
MRLPVLLLLCLFNAASAAEFSARIIAVLDGDTVLLRQANTLTKIRLAGIDAPEKDQPYGMVSKQSLADLVLNKEVRVTSRAVDDYGRLVATLSLEGLDVNAEQLRRGMAWEYSRFHSNKPYLALQTEAQQTKRGLWAMADPVPPGLWRKQHPSTWPAQTKATAPAPPPKVASSTLDPLCLRKKHCSEMTSCDEARHYFTVCGAQPLDGDKDGKPCETLCAGKPDGKN